jgi:hypothetical protein
LKSACRSTTLDKEPFLESDTLMAKIRERVVFNKEGRPAGVHLDFTECADLLAELEVEQCARAYDEATASGGDAVPFEQAVSEIERGLS